MELHLCSIPCRPAPLYPRIGRFPGKLDLYFMLSGSSILLWPFSLYPLLYLLLSFTSFYSCFTQPIHLWLYPLYPLYPPEIAFLTSLSLPFYLLRVIPSSPSFPTYLSVHLHFLFTHSFLIWVSFLIYPLFHLWTASSLFVHCMHIRV